MRKNDIVFHVCKYCGRMWVIKPTKVNMLSEYFCSIFSLDSIEFYYCHMAVLALWPYGFLALKQALMWYFPLYNFWITIIKSKSMAKIEFCFLFVYILDFITLCIHSQYIPFSLAEIQKHVKRETNTVVLRHTNNLGIPSFYIFMH